MNLFHKQLFSLILFLSAFNSYSQIFKPGIIIGVVTSDLDGSDFKDGDNDFSKAGFTAGGLLNVKLSEKNSFQFEILYTQKGTLQKGDSVGNGYYKSNLNYVEVPLMFKHNIVFNIRKKRVDNFYFELGPSYGRLVQVKQEGIYSYGSGYQNDFKSNEVAINFGLGCRIFQGLYANIRYCNSIMPVVTQNSNNFSSSFFWYTFNRGNNLEWSFTLRYIFSKEKKEEKEKGTDSEN